MIITQVVSRVEDGKLVRKGEFDEIVRNFEGKAVLVTVKKYSGQKSREQRGFYFAGIVETAAKQWAWHKDEVHEWLKMNFNKREREIQVGNQIVILSVGGSTKDLERDEYSRYIDRCAEELIKLGVYIPTPEEYTKTIEGNTKLTKERDGE